MTLNINDLWRLCTAIKNYAESESEYTALTSQLANTVLASPDGSSGSVGYRTLVANDIPNLDASKITSGTFNASIIGSGVIDNSHVNWASPAAIGTSTPAAAEFTNLFVATGFYGKRVLDSATAGALSVASNIGIVYHRGNGLTSIDLPSLASLYLIIDGTSGFAPLIFIRNESGISAKTITPAGGEDIDGAATLNLPIDSAVVLAGISTTRWRAMMDFP